ncbi:MAG: hypothetical protein E3J72_00150 [Planctomycetota bacterium]|nr:MAG: hypothetical protein E3J72_00150 [Planctomycetota bacterium]
MENTVCKSENRKKFPSSPTVGMGTRLIRLFLSILLVLAFIFFIGPWIAQAPFVKPLTTFIDERNIDAGALFYTEVEEFSDADVYMRNTMNHAPQVHQTKP